MLHLCLFILFSDLKSLLSTHKKHLSWNYSNQAFLRWYSRVSSFVLTTYSVNKYRFCIYFLLITVSLVIDEKHLDKLRTGINAKRFLIGSHSTQTADPSPGLWEQYFSHQFSWQTLFDTSDSLSTRWKSKRNIIFFSSSFLPEFIPEMSEHDFAC